MISSLRGRIIDLTPDSVTLDVAGVGYGCSVALPTYERLRREGHNAVVRLFTHLHFTETAGPSLYAFTAEDERSVFRLLLNGSGVGPKLALAAISVLEPGELLGALADGDIKKLCRVSGIGNKKAEKLSVELKDRAAELAVKIGVPAAVPTRSDAVAALVSLGYVQRDAELAVERAKAELGGEAELRAIVTSALAHLRS